MCVQSQLYRLMYSVDPIIRLSTKGRCCHNSSIVCRVEKRCYCICLLTQACLDLNE